MSASGGEGASLPDQVQRMTGTRQRLPDLSMQMGLSYELSEIWQNRTDGV